MLSPVSTGMGDHLPVGILSLASLQGC